jgi:hypothetical protein
MQALAHRRQSVYTVFVRVPIGVIHGLAAAPLGLGEEDGEEDEEEEGQQQGNDPHVEDLEALTNSAGRRRVGNGALEGSLAIGDGKSGAHNNNSGALSPKGRRGATTEPSAAGGPARATTPPQKGFFGTLASWLAPASTDVSVKGKAGLYGGRSLVKSYKDTILLVGVTEINGSKGGFWHGVCLLGQCLVGLLVLKCPGFAGCMVLLDRCIILGWNPDTWSCWCVC